MTLTTNQPIHAQPNQWPSNRSWRLRKQRREPASLCAVSSPNLESQWSGRREVRCWSLERSTRWSRRPLWMNCCSTKWCQKTVETTAVCVETRRPQLVSRSRVGRIVKLRSMERLSKTLYSRFLWCLHDVGFSLSLFVFVFCLSFLCYIFFSIIYFMTLTTNQPLLLSPTSDLQTEVGDSGSRGGSQHHSALWALQTWSLSGVEEGNSGAEVWREVPDEAESLCEWTAAQQSGARRQWRLQLCVWRPEDHS